jgi:hypothetical protein
MMKAINELPLPQDLLELIRTGRWRMPADTSLFDALFPERHSTASLYSLDGIRRESTGWRKGTRRMFLGTPDTENPPGDIDPEKSILVGDLGLGSDQPIALDYRTDPPRVLTLRWSHPPDEKNRWTVVAPDILRFAHRIGLR